MGPGLRVSGKLAIGGRRGRGQNRQCFIRELPALSAGRLKLAHCPSLTHLPEGLEVVSLELSACDALQSLPEDLNLKELRITGCRSLRALPKRMKVERLVLTNAAIEEIPDFFGARQVLISGCRRLRSLPPAWSGAEISLKHLPKIAAVPDINAAWEFRVSYLPLVQQIESRLESPYILVSNCDHLVRFVPQHLKVERLDLSVCRNLEVLPGSLEAKLLRLTGCLSLRALPSPLRLGKDNPAEVCLDLTRCRLLENLPDDYTLGGALQIDGSGLEEREPARLDFTIHFRGVALPATAFYQPGKLDPGEVLLEQNAELRRVLVERIGIEKVLAHAKAVVLDEDTDAGGPRKLLRLADRKSGGPDITYLCCRCPSTQRVYLLRVPPDLRQCRRAAAWLAGFSNPDDYQPVLET